MIKKFLIIAIFGVFTFNANLICHSLHMDKHGNTGHSSSTDTCPIKGACPHHNNNAHSHDRHHEADGETFIKCDCSVDYKQIFSSRESIPSERPPSILA
ncbi:MAG: hypothetical protein HZB79_04730 [Deltaproteobacteria bacterium]|nr:hypothetical protein [Deltaproteobacteria bacterium]